MDPNQAILFAQLVNVAYAGQPGVVAPGGAVALPRQFGAFNTTYVIETSIFGSDLANDLNILRGQNVVTYGYVLRDANNNVVVAIRGTEGVYEWLHDFYFLYTPFRFVPGAGNTEDGFTTIYESLRVSAVVGAQRLNDYLLQSHAANAFNSLTICGHSLGGALATLLGLEYGVTSSKDATLPEAIVYTYASPRVGDSSFADLYNHVVPTNYRIANRVDLVPKLPLPPMYEHVGGLVDLNPSTPGNPPSTLITFNVPCEHILSSYLFLLSQLPGVSPNLQNQFPLSTACGATAAHVLPANPPW